MTTVLMVSGSWPPQACGVGDYAEKLSRELERHAISVMRFGSEQFAHFYAPDIVHQIGTTDCDIIHIQYPTAGYGRSLTPSVLARSIRNKPVVVTLHEYSLFRWYRRLWFSQFAEHCDARIFTTDEERDLYRRRFQSRNGIDATIAIGSNIPAALQTGRQPDRVCHFGLIAPGKGIDEFLELCTLAASSKTCLSFVLIGAIPERHIRYANDVLKRAAALNVQVFLNLPEHAVAEHLSNSTYAYLPFPDGASAKRGTLAAAIVNGLIVITTHSSITPQWVRSATLNANTPHDALHALLRLRDDSHGHSKLRDRAESAVSHFSWSAIAQHHADLYRYLLTNEATHHHGSVNTATKFGTDYESKLAS